MAGVIVKGMSFSKKKKPTGMTGGKKRVSGIPSWVKAIPKSEAHGSGDLQKRLWRLTSDYVRIRDWYKYGRCVATKERIRHWTQGNAGHFKSYSVCNGMYKFDPDNIHLQSAQSNAWGGMDIGHKFAEELKNRYGQGYITLIEDDNFLHRGEQITNTKILDMMKEYLHHMSKLPEQPTYYVKVIKLLK